MTQVHPDQSRQPSTWEAMVRAELGNSNRDHAIALIKRVQERYVKPIALANTY